MLGYLTWQGSQEGSHESQESVAELSLVPHALHVRACACMYMYGTPARLHACTPARLHAGNGLA